jgi:excisionase family DNA binding protein
VIDLRSVLAADVVAAIEDLVERRVEAALALHEMNGSSPWLGLGEAAAYLGVSERTISRLLDQGRIRSTFLGRRRLLHRGDLDEYLRGGGA